MLSLTHHKSLVILIAALVIWELIWKGIALWRAAKNRHHAWFIIMLVVNTAGLLPIFYILWFPKDHHKNQKPS